MGLQDDILLGINDFILLKFQDNTYNYMYESDIQCELFGMLRANTSSYSSVEKNINGQIYLLPLIISECHKEISGEKKRIDLACIDPNKNNGVSVTKLDELWNTPLLVGIELKLLGGGYLKKYGPTLHSDDINKLEALSKIEGDDFKYISLNFIQDEWVCLNNIPDNFTKQAMPLEYGKTYYIGKYDIYRII